LDTNLDGLSHFGGVVEHGINDDSDSRSHDDYAKDVDTF
jgi:hypothetical protein